MTLIAGAPAARRFSSSPIITPHMDARMGSNINGPSLIRVPEWLPSPLGRYYLYFAHHHGTYIRLAYADRLEGPWRTYAPGTLQIEQSYFDDHVASPDVHVDHERREVRMYYHGKMKAAPGQFSRVSTSGDGLRFEPREEILGASYFRVIRRGSEYLALGMPGIFYRSPDGLTGFERGPTLFSPDMRHSAFKLDGEVLSVFYTDVGRAPPERILLSRIDLSRDWGQWQASAPVAVLEPEGQHEGTDLPQAPSVRGWAPERVRQLRDPAVFQEAGRTYLLYSVAGEHGIAIAELTD